MNVQDYSKIFTMQKEFKPYSDLWLSIDDWFSFKNQWINGPLEEVDAPYVDKWVNDRLR